MPDHAIDFFSDAALFLVLAEDYLAAAPVVTNVVATVATRAMAEGRPPTPQFWFALLRDDVRVVGVAMRTAPFEPYPLFVCPMPDQAARLLARSLHERGEHPGGANGSLPAARVVAEESARLWGGRVETAMSSRLWELGELSVPSGVEGRARPATYDDVAVCLAWFNDFDRAAREQAGNATAAQGGTLFTREDIRTRIADGRILLWERDGEVVHMTAVNPSALGGPDRPGLHPRRTPRPPLCERDRR